MQLCKARAAARWLPNWTEGLQPCLWQCTGAAAAPITAEGTVLQWAPAAPAQQPEGSPSRRPPVLVRLTSSLAIQVLEKQPQDPAAWNNLGNATAGVASRAIPPAWGTPCMPICASYCSGVTPRHSQSGELRLQGSVTGRRPWSTMAEPPRWRQNLHLQVWNANTMCPCPRAQARLALLH